MSNRTDFLVSGAGIGGLALALALARNGRTVRLLEQSTAFRDTGTGLLLSPNATRMLDRLGISDRLRAQACRPERTELRDAMTGAPVFSGPPADAVAARYGADYLTALRGDLLHLLLDACREQPGVDVRFGHGIIDFGDAHPGAYAVTEEGERLEARALVGACGTWSPMRARLVGDGDPHVSGYVACRALLPRDEVPADCWSPSIVIWAGPRTHVAQYPVRNGEMLNVVAVFRSQRYEPGWNAAGDPHDLHAPFLDQHPTVQRLVATIDTARTSVLCDRDPVAKWGSGPMTLLGDAAHPMLLALGQSAAMALEDAVCLADMFERHPDDAPAALRAYERARYLRTGRVQLAARFYDQVFHAGGVAAELRGLMVREGGAEAGLLNLDWLYGGPGDW